MKRLLIIPALLAVTVIASFWMLSFSTYPAEELQTLEAAPAASPTPKTNDNVNRATSEPYSGDLAIFEEPEREKNLQIDRVMDILKISEGKTVADIGAGSGWFTMRAAKRVGAKGRVFAVEINQEYINYINDRAKKESFTNINTILGKTDDPLLPKSSVDAVLILKTYHEIAEPVRFMKNLKTGLGSDALVGVIDRNGDGGDHGIQKESIVEEAGRAGFKLKEEFDFVKPDGMDYFLVFQLQK
ncbi:MAG: methyltransferase domain-containing protein [Pyrinomonadaceae bacterium]|nr:methyltransferase domain-containing protein [Acidobacteriota bacterium]